MIAFFPDRPAQRLSGGLSGALLLLLAACASEPTPIGETGTALPPPGAGEPAAASSEPAPATAVPPPPLPEPSSTSIPPQEPAEGESVIVKGPDGTTWRASPATNEQTYQADLDDCYSYATAQTRHDAQIMDDRNAGIDTLTSQSRYSGLRQRVDEYDLRNRRASLMSSCMESKGYARADTVLPRLEF